MNAFSSSFILALALLFAPGCSKGEAAVATPTPSGPPHPAADCAHAVCADNFYVDSVTPDECVAGASCRLTLKLVAVGDFHINDEYPYRFKADETPGVEFSGTDGAGKAVFSKPAGNWSKTSEKSGAMAVSFTPSHPGATAISGTFKLSVCSAQNCLLEQRSLSASVVVR